MSWASVSEAWLEKLQDEVPGLTEALTHLYAPWSLEALTAGLNERHLAVWPNGEPETLAAALAGGPPADLASQSYTILVWEDASAESTRRIDDDAANIEWLELHEAIRDQLYDLGNRNLGDPQSSNLRYQGAAFDAIGGCRVLQVQFTTQTYHSFTG